MVLIYLTSLLAPWSLWYWLISLSNHSSLLVKLCLCVPKHGMAEGNWKLLRSPSTPVLGQAWLPGYQCLVFKALLALIEVLLALIGGFSLLKFKCILVNIFVILVAFYYLDQVERACGVKWKAFTFKFRVMSELTRLKVLTEWWLSEELGVWRKGKPWLEGDSPK